MSPKAKTIEVRWDGPYSWPGYESENGLRPIPEIPGVYLPTFEYQRGYLIYTAGVTTVSIPKRFKKHDRSYMNGECNVLDMAAVQQGVRTEIWHGWGYARKHREEFEERKSEILDAVRKQLAAFRIFVTDMGMEPSVLKREPRVLYRLEAAIICHLYQQPSPFCCIPDRGMSLRRRRDSEDPIIVRNNCAVLVHKLPALLEI